VDDEQVIPWGIDLVGYQTNMSNEPIKIGVLDSGINENHEDLQGKVLKEYNVINPGEPVDDDYGHGTAIAGIITANDNDVGIVGVVQDVVLYDIKVLNDEGKGNVEDLITAIKWCMEEQVDIINISFGFQSKNNELEEIIQEAVSQGIIFVAASGNNYGLKTDYPAKYENVISVTAVNEEKKESNLYSSEEKVDYAMPGVSILTTSKDGGYEIHSGTSMATAYMTGIVSSYLKDYKSTDDEEVFLIEKINKILEENLIPINGCSNCGKGLVKINE
jgi:subtilisin family serine protease